MEFSQSLAHQGITRDEVIDQETELNQIDELDLTNCLDFDEHEAINDLLLNDEF